MTVPDAVVTIRENDVPGVVLSGSSVTVEEGDTTGESYTVRLATRPSATTTVEVSGQAGTDLELSGLSASSTLTFTTSNWNSPRTVTVTASNDDDAVVDIETLTHTANGGDYRDVTKELTVTVTDDETASIEISRSSLEPVENATGTTYTVRLSSEPTATTTVGITGHGDAPISLDRSALTFTATNWDIPQTVTVTATPDADAVDDEITLVHTANGGDYVNVTRELAVTVDDDEETDLKLSATSLAPVEGGSAQTYTVSLTSQPTGTVTVEISGHSGTDLALSGVSASSTLTFTSSNWDTPRTVTVKAGQDADALDDVVTLTHTASGGDYRNETASLRVTVEDDESPHLVLSKESISPVEGSPSGDGYTVRLGSQPTATATVAISGHDGTDLTLSTTTLTFTTSNWNTAQTVTATAAQDPDAADDETTLTHTATGGDYAGVNRDLPVTVKDDETASIVLSATELEPGRG